MTIFYMDPVGGNNANNGLSFANRIQNNFPNAQPGDTIRFIESPAPTSMGQDATWTDNSTDVTLTTAVTADIYQSGAWTAATTNATLTTSTQRKIGATSVSVAVNATFTTGKAAYLTLPAGTTDFSAYQQVSFWIVMTSGTMAADGDISIRLCSDTTGDVTVNTIAVPRMVGTNNWTPVTVNTGAALGSAIQSIALYIDVDRGAQTFLLNNVLACKAASDADSLTLTSLISKNTGTEPWLAIQSINGVTIQPEFFFANTTPNSTVKYSGVTETVTLYKREPLIMPISLRTSNTTPILNYGRNGAAGNPIIISGGWNSTDMSTQTGESYYSAVNGYSPFFRINTASSYTTVSKLNLFKASSAYLFVGGAGYSTNWVVSAKDLNSNATSISLSTNSTQAPFSGITDSTFTIDNITGTQSAGFSLSGNADDRKSNIQLTVINLNSNAGSGVSVAGASSTRPATGFLMNATNCNQNSSAAVSQTTISQVMFSIENCDRNRNNGLSIQGPGHMVTVTNSLSNNSNGLSLAGTNCVINLSNATVTGNTTDINQTGQGAGNLVIGGQYSSGGIVIVGNNNYTATDTRTLTLQNPGGTSTLTYTRQWSPPSYVAIGGMNNNNSDNRIYYHPDFGDIVTDATTRHTASGVSWKMTVGSTTTEYSPLSYAPLTLPVAKIAVSAGSLVTATVWVYRTDTNLVTKFVCPGGQIAGVASDVVATAAGAINTWEQLTITFTPSAQGVVALEIDCYGAAASVYVDDFGATQA